MALFEARDIRTRFTTSDGIVGAVDGVSSSVEQRPDARNRR